MNNGPNTFYWKGCLRSDTYTPTPLQRDRRIGRKTNNGIEIYSLLFRSLPLPLFGFREKKCVFRNLFFFRSLSLSAEASLAAPVQVRKLTFFTFHISWPMTSAELLLVVLFILCKEKSTFEEASANNIFLQFKFFATHALDFPTCVPFFFPTDWGVGANSWSESWVAV